MAPDAAPATDLVRALRAIVGDEHATGADAERRLHSHDESDLPPALPDAVVFPASTDEVAAMVTLAAETATPVVGWGAGSSVGGHPIPVAGGIVVDFRRMDRVITVDTDNFQAVVQPGIRRLELERHLGTHGLFFAPDPGADASVGGMLANNAAGIRALRYGQAAANVFGLVVVLADGSVIRTGSKSVKQSAGYDLTRLFVGSEGTLGLITEATIRLHPIPDHTATIVIGFADVAAAARSVHGIIGMGLQPTALELIHQDHLLFMNDEEGTDYVVAPSLMVEFAGPSEVVVSDAMDLTRRIALDGGATGFDDGMTRQDRSRLWRLRHGMRERLRRRFPGDHWVAMDAAVPIASFAALVEFAEDLAAAHGFSARVVGHAGDGNIHMGMNYDPSDLDRAALAADIGGQIVNRAIELGGTCSGEHGIGLGKMRYMRAEHGDGAVAAMWSIKRALDPHNILNPHKILPELP